MQLNLSQFTGIESSLPILLSSLNGGGQPIGVPKLTSETSETQAQGTIDSLQ